LIPSKNPANKTQPMEEKLTVSVDNTGIRLDKFLQTNLSAYSRTKINNLIHKGNVLVNGRVKKPSYRLKAGETVTLKAEEKKETLKPFAFDVKIIYEDNEILVVDKPGGITVHPANETAADTLINALFLSMWPSASINPFMNELIIIISLA